MQISFNKTKRKEKPKSSSAHEIQKADGTYLDFSKEHLYKTYVINRAKGEKLDWSNIEYSLIMSEIPSQTAKILVEEFKQRYQKAS